MNKPLRLIAALCLIAAIALAAYFVIKSKSEAKSPAAPPPVPVSMVLATTQDVPHILNAVGTVTSLQSVTIRTQVDGILTGITVNEGDHVVQGQILASIDDRELQAELRMAQAQLESDRAQLRAAELDLTRQEQLLKKKAISQKTFDDQKARTDQLRAAVQGDEARIENVNTRLSYTQITSPVAGRVGMRAVDPGNFIRVNDAGGLFTVTQMNPISVIFSVPQSIFPKLNENMRAQEQVEVKALDRESGAEIASGQISALDNSVQAATGTVQVRAVFENAAEKLWPGQFVSVIVPVGSTKSGLTVPAAAVRMGVSGPFVYRIGEDNSVAIVPVKTGYSNDDLAVIEDGVTAGDRIVTDGFVRLKHGIKVKIIDGSQPGGTP